MKLFYKYVSHISIQDLIFYNEKKILGILIVLLLLFPGLYNGENNNKIDPVSENRSKEKIIERIGFLKNSDLGGYEVNDEIFLGIQIKESIYFKICSMDKDNVIKGGYFNRGLNILAVQLSLITGENKGIFFLFLKGENLLIKKQIVLIPDIDVNAGGEDGWVESSTVNDRKRHEMTITGKSGKANRGSSSLVIDPMTGEYPGLNRGFSFIPVIAFLAEKIFRPNRNKKKEIQLFSDTAVYLKRKKSNGKEESILLNLSIRISDL